MTLLLTSLMLELLVELDTTQHDDHLGHDDVVVLHHSLRGVVALQHVSQAQEIQLALALVFDPSIHRRDIC